MEEIKESQAYKDSEALAAAPGKLQLARALTEEGSNVEHVVLVQKPKTEDKPPESGTSRRMSHKQGRTKERTGSLQGTMCTTQRAARVRT